MKKPLKYRGALCASALAALCLTAHAELARVGPLNLPSPTGHGFPRWYQDISGLALDLCLPNASDPGALQQNACLQPSPAPYTFPTTFPDEAFYFSGNASLTLPGGLAVTYVSALEAGFGGGTAVVGDQIVFARVRIRADLPEPGTYTFTHPWGTYSETLDAVTGKRDVNVTDDFGLAVLDFATVLGGRIGPFLRAAAVAGGPALPPVTLNGAQFLSDGTLQPVTGSPFNTNFLMVCGTRPDGTPIALGTTASGANPSCIRTDLFALAGRVHDSATDPIGSPLAIQAATYSRDAAGTHVNVGAQVARVLTTQPTPLLTAASNQTPPVRLNGPDALNRYFAQGFTDPSGALPGQIIVTNSGDNPPTSVTSATRDVVTVVSASYNASTQTLTAVATSSDKGFGASLSPPLAFDGFATTATRGGVPGDTGSFTLVATGVAIPPTQVVVHSVGGGIGRVDLTTDPNLASPPGSPFTRDDSFTAPVNTPAVNIPVLANDLAHVAAPINPASVTIVAGGVTPAGLGTAVVNPDGTIRFTPGLTVGSGTLKYVVSSAAVPGASNVGTVNITLTPSPSGTPIGTADTVSMVTGATLNINVVANDSGNGGTLVPTSTQIVAGSVSGGTATVAANGTVNFRAGLTPGANFGFSYTVANSNGNRSVPIRVAVNVADEPVGITPGSAQCTRTGTRWRLAGTGAVPNTVVTMYTTAVAPAVPTAAQTAGSTTALANGTWAIDRSGGPACGTTASLRTASGTLRNNIVVRVR